MKQIIKMEFDLKKATLRADYSTSYKVTSNIFLTKELIYSDIDRSLSLTLGDTILWNTLFDFISRTLMSINYINDIKDSIVTVELRGVDVRKQFMQHLHSVNNIPKLGSLVTLSELKRCEITIGGIKIEEFSRIYKSSTL